LAAPSCVRDWITVISAPGMAFNAFACALPIAPLPLMQNLIEVFLSWLTFGREARAPRSFGRSVRRSGKPTRGELPRMAGVVNGLRAQSASAVRA